MTGPGRPIDQADLDNRFRFHPATDVTGPLHEMARERCLELAEWLVATVPPGRELSTAVTKLEEVMMWANAGIARHQDLREAREAPGKSNAGPA